MFDLWGKCLSISEAKVIFGIFFILLALAAGHQLSGKQTLDSPLPSGLSVSSFWNSSSCTFLGFVVQQNTWTQLGGDAVCFVRITVNGMEQL